MKQDLKVLAEHIEKKVGKAHVFHKMWDVLKGKEKPSRQTLDKLALLAGFQSWDDFQGALHGTEDGLVNYDAGEKKQKRNMVGSSSSHDLLNRKDSCFSV